MSVLCSCMLCWIHGLKEFLHLKMTPDSAHGCAGSFFHPTAGPNNQVINCSLLKQEVGCCSWHKILLGSGILNLKWKDKMAPESSAVWGTVPKSFSVPSPSKYLRAVTGQGCLSKQSLPEVCRACSEMSDLFGAAFYWADRCSYKWFTSWSSAMFFFPQVLTAHN